MEKQYFIEIMAHILTIEDILASTYNIDNELINQQKDLNKKSIKEQLNKKEVS